LGYDLAWEVEVLPSGNPDPLPFPVAFWYEPVTFAVLDHQQQQLWLAAAEPQQLDQMEKAIAAAPDWQVAPVLFTDQLTLAMEQATYEAAVRRAKAYIQAGDIFQANLSLRFSAPTAADSWGIYRRLQKINPSPFASYWRTPWGAVMSCSPERLVSLQGDRAETRPIAGTRARGQTPQQDQALAQELQTNRKERAEHIMLVDLERNDLGRVCTWGTVQVDELMTLEPYSHVMHLVSNVVGTLAPDKTPIDLIRAVFPGGTITGCPKVRCMEIIEELEPVRRSLFYGSCGYLDWRGQLDLNILIRTLLWTHDPMATTPVVWGQVGAGIVADSQPPQEWLESLQKAKAQLLALGMVLEG
jgi:para-aminobenzoate synthetase component 1